MGIIIAIGFVLVTLLLAAGIYVYRCTHYWQRDARRTRKAGFVEKNVQLPSGAVIHYAQGPDHGKALLLIHGQTGAWSDYTKVLPALSRHWQVFVVDCYGHGQSTHREDLYYLDTNGDDLIWFVHHIIGKETVVSGHSSGGLLAAYVAAYAGDKVVGAVLEDPPVFSTEKACFDKTFAYHDTYLPMHNYLQSDRSVCWEAYYLRHCLWGRLYMPKAMDGLAKHAQKIADKHPGRPVQLFYMPESINCLFLTTKMYDLLFGEHFYDDSWHHSLAHAKLMADITVPTVFLHAQAQYTDDGILMAASSDEQAREAAGLIGDCTLVEAKSNHNFHRFNEECFLDAIEKLS